MLKTLKAKLQLSRDLIRRRIGIWLFDTTKTLPTIKTFPKKIVLVRWDAKYGDAIVSSWFIREIKKIDANIKVEIITTQDMAWIFKDYFYADTIHLSKKRPDYTSLYKLAKSIHECDLVVHFSKGLKLKDIFFLKMLQTTYIAGLDDEIKLNNIKLGKKTDNQKFSTKFAHIFEYFNADKPNMEYIVPLDVNSLQRVKPLFTNKKVICFNPYGGANSRRLNRKNIGLLLDIFFLHVQETTIQFLYAPNDKEEVEYFANKYPYVSYDNESSSILDVTSQISLCNGVISVDTATVHMADGFHKPLLAIFMNNENTFNEWGPSNDKAITTFINDIYPVDVNNINLEDFEAKVILWRDKFL